MIPGRDGGRAARRGRRVRGRIRIQVDRAEPLAGENRNRLRSLVAHQGAGDDGRRDDPRARRQVSSRRSRDAFFSELRRARQDRHHVSPSAGALLGPGGVASVLSADRGNRKRRARQFHGELRRQGVRLRGDTSREARGAARDQNHLLGSGFILLGETIEKVSSVALNRYCREKIFRPLGLRATDYIDISQVRSRRLEPVPDMFAPTEICPSRKRLLVGEVDDENAFAMGGVAGHAGLFAPVREVDRIASELIACYAGRSNFVPQKIIREFWTRDATVPGSTWALGWDTPSPEHSSSGHRLLAGGGRASRLHRHIDLDRAGERNCDFDADQPGSSAARQSEDSRLPPEDSRPDHGRTQRWLIPAAQRASRAFQRPSATCT